MEERWRSQPVIPIAILIAMKSSYHVLRHLVVVGQTSIASMAMSYHVK